MKDLHLREELWRLRTLRQATAHQFRHIFLERTMRSVMHELRLLRPAGGPGFVVGKACNGNGYYYDVEEVLRYFGGNDAVFHRDDRPELFSKKVRRVVVKPRHAP